MGKNVAQKLIESHLVGGKTVVGEEVSLKIDQTLCQDATGTMVMLELEAIGLEKTRAELSAQYVDHNLIQTDFKNPDDHVFLQSACEKFGLYYSRAGNGVSHPVHMERFGIPGKTLLGSDSHTCAAGSLGMLAMGTGGLEVALAIVGEPFVIKYPKIFGIKLTGKLPDWVSAKDLILEVLRRHDVSGGIGKIIEYYGPGLDHLSAMDRHVIANMGAELGATASVFPSDKQTKEFLVAQRRGNDWVELVADKDATYDEHDEINLSELEPLIALPSSPGKVVPVSEVAGREVYQCMVGSSANPGLRDFAIPAIMVEGKQIHPRVSFDINPTSRQILQNMTESGWLASLIACGGRIHQPGCNGCIGMGQAPATGRISLRTNPRNFPGRSGTKEDSVYLCSPEVATASALTGVITDPRTLGMKYPHYKRPKRMIINTDAVLPPPKDTKPRELIRGPNIKPLPSFEPLEQTIAGPVLLKVGDNISTDAILPAGTKVLPFRSNIPEIAKFTYSQIDETFYDRAMEHQTTGFFIIGGSNYGQGSSREHAAIAPRYMGLRAVIAKSYARIHRKNLINFGMAPLFFKSDADYDAIDQGDDLVIPDIKKAIEKRAPELTVENLTKGTTFTVTHDLSDDEEAMLLVGGLINRAIHKMA
jgi:predicted aconitate hydratase